MEVTEPAEAVKEAEEDAAATVTDAGTVRVVLLEERATLAPPVGAAWERVTVQVLEEFCPRVVGLQVSEETVTGGVTPCVVAVAEADWAELLPAAS